MYADVRLTVDMRTCGMVESKAVRDARGTIPGRLGTGNAMMLAEMQKDAGARDLRVERKVVAEAMFPIEREAQEADVEFFRLVDREDAQDGDHLLQIDGGAHPYLVGGLAVGIEDVVGALLIERHVVGV